MTSPNNRHASPSNFINCICSTGKKSSGPVFTLMMLPGIKVNTGPDDFFPVEQMQLMKFDGEAWRLFGDVIDGEVGHAP